MEVAAGLAGAGLSTTMVFPDPHLLSRLFTAKIAGFYETVFEGGCDSGLSACRHALASGLHSLRRDRASLAPPQSLNLLCLLPSHSLID